jgi:transcriptional regulator with XRE-family HTH domain
MNDIDRLRIARNIQKLRRRHAYRQIDIAGMFYVDRSRYSLMENGKADISLDLLLDLARFYNVTIEDIVYTDDLDIK